MRLRITPLIVAAGITAVTSVSSLAGGMFWVVGNAVTNSCNIVQHSPVVDPSGPVWFGNGPYKSYNEAKLARRGISACPSVDD